MIVCKNCGADIPFIPDTQTYTCPYCGTVHTHEELTAQEQAGEINAELQHFSIPSENLDTDMEVFVYTCPQCSGELMTTEETLSTFCSYCGASVQLKQRVDKQEKPKYIIPFQISQEKAMEIYNQKMAEAKFAPSYLKHMDIEKVRGIYMPFWTYSLQSSGVATATYEEEIAVKGGKRIKKYKVDTDVELIGNGIEYDAASSFPDDLSQSSAPYHFKEAKPFAASYMSGFYADAGDVPKTVYEKNAEADLFAIAKEELEKDMGAPLSTIQIHANSKIVAEKCLYPVWFVSARNAAENKVSYAVINGQTGKIAADIPTDPKKMILSMFLFAIPIFFILNIFVTATPWMVSLIHGIFDIITWISVWLRYDSIKDAKQDTFLNQSNAPSMSLCFVALVINAALCYINPFQDMYHYIGAIASTILCISAYALTFRISNANMVRDLPQFNRRGGDI